jgi:diguanylate cyclase (GGDEF)-like protein
VLSDRVHTLHDDQQQGLQLLGHQVSALLRARQQGRQLAGAMAELSRMLNVDPLTGLGNRAAATSGLSQMCDAGGGAVLFIDMDGLKAINDRTGHAAGDEALQEVARRLRLGLRPQDQLTRWAGDEFVALVPGLHDQSQLRSLIARVTAAVDGAHDRTDPPLRLSASVGGCLVVVGDDPADVLQRADAAMYDVKQRRRARQ